MLNGWKKRKFYQVILDDDDTKAVKVMGASDFADIGSARAVKAEFERVKKKKARIIEVQVKTKEVN